jgi:hypothetical protein
VLGFTGLPEADRRVVSIIWKVTGSGSGFLLPRGLLPRAPGRQAQVDADTTSLPAWPRVPAQRPQYHCAQQSAAAPEQAAHLLFSQIFALEPGKAELLMRGLRPQAAGAGPGTGLDCEAAGLPAVRCHVECKNLDRPVSLKDIADKLIQQEQHDRGTQVDHWILISPHHGPASELQAILSGWERDGKYPFSVQVWSPETHIRELFALAPDAYAAIYGRQPAEQEAGAGGHALRVIRKRLAPRPRIAPVWRRYLSAPQALCFANEPWSHFEELYHNHLPLKAADERGSVLAGDLMSQVRAWARGGDQRSMLLLADFGDGKSVFTYCLSRRLCEEFRGSPARGTFPLRIPLREFTEAKSARGLLERRLSEIGATLADWRELASAVPTLVILDGFDEMSADLSPATVTSNMRGIASFFQQLPGSRILVTSRQRVIDGTRDWERTLDKLQRPRTIRIACSTRRERVQYLEQITAACAPASALARLRTLYDPIGLARKPLFLQMIKETLGELPDGTFGELVLYQTYIGKSLRHKIEFLEDRELSLTTDELVGNLEEILEDIAVRMQQSNRSYLFLRDYQEQTGSMARMLWKMRDQPAARSFGSEESEDAASRVGIRSLLKAVPVAGPDGDRWPVDFFHRSMREFFVARAIVRRLSADPDEARAILRSAPLLPEVTHFAAKLLWDSPDPVALASLESFARSATLALETGCLGGNALTLLYASAGRLPRADWSGLRLDHAQLSGADLSGACFAGSSLRHANLDNANLSNADFSGTDLEGVLLEETSRVLAVTAAGGGRIIASYEDHSLREWRSQAGGTWKSRVIAMLERRAHHLQLTPGGQIIAWGSGIVTVLDPGGTGSGTLAPAGGTDPRLTCTFGTNPRFQFAIAGSATALFTKEAEGGKTRATWLDMGKERAVDELEVDAAVTSCAQVDGRAYAIATEREVRVAWFEGDGQRAERVLDGHLISCVALHADDRGVLVASGYQDGTVSITRIAGGPGDGDPVALWRHRVHDRTVTSIYLDGDEHVITGSTDRSVCVTPVEARAPEGPDRNPDETATALPLPRVPVQRLELTLRCQGVKFDDVRPEHEQAKLREYSAT